jgi:hypothetical protein
MGGQVEAGFRGVRAVVDLVWVVCTNDGQGFMRKMSRDFQGSLYGLLLGIFYPSGIDHPSVVDILIPIFICVSVGAIIGSILSRTSRQAKQKVLAQDSPQIFRSDPGQSFHS